MINVCLSACTAEMDIGEVEVDGVKVTLYDTPGMCDTSRSDAEILGKLAKVCVS